MSEKLSEVFEAYDMEVYQVVRGRESSILKTDKGIRQLKKLTVGEKRLNAEKRYKEELLAGGFSGIDFCIENMSGELVSYDRYGNAYVLRNYFEGSEANLTNLEDVRLAVESLAKLHIVGRKIFQTTEHDVHVRHVSDFRKRNQELKRVRAFIMKKKQKKAFEELYIQAFEYFYNQALECEKNFDVEIFENIKEHIGYCHGMYNQHSVIISRDEKPFRVFTTSFDKFHVGNQLTDLYHFLRKAVEKNNYSFHIVQYILNCYSAVCPLSVRDIEYIYILYSYPEKFYKISNQYMNAPKNWISPKMMEKLNKVIADEDQKKDILLQLKNIDTSHF